MKIEVKIANIRPSLMKTLRLTFSITENSNLPLLELMQKFLINKQRILAEYISNISSENLTYPSLEVSSGCALTAAAFCGQDELFNLRLL